MDRSGDAPARNQQAFGPWVIGSNWYVLLADINTDFNPAMYVSTDLGVTWTIVDAAGSPTFFRTFGMAPVLVGTVLYVAYADRSATG